MSLDQKCAAAAAIAWVNKRGAIQLRASWYPHAITVSVREGAEHGKTPSFERRFTVGLFKHPDNMRHLSPTLEDKALARGYVQLVHTLMGEKGNKVEVQYVGFK